MKKGLTNGNIFAIIYTQRKKERDLKNGSFDEICLWS